ncbi:class I SAM-dependent DNA methyltransferase [Patulibacter sp. SYSU D01012]|uniref:class I SAM-dependent DNA methyltransferase n=1 Tax=Patulibacter sp. SYSU D01012 TaxID=2817381 RepID=UPI001B306D79|nr:class I SAM-dependent DNA methyltransferase [Patulibacter sp. SYSU D01012]
MKQPMNDHSRALVDKLWAYCNILRDDGLSYGDYVEQLTYLLFLKMAHERTQAPLNEPYRLPGGFDWPSLLGKSGPALEAHYVATLGELGKQPGLLGLIFRKAQNRIQDPQKLRRLIVDLIDQETWMGVDADIKGDAYEGLLEKNAADTKSGAGQYFTPRALIRAMVDVMRPRPGQTIGDPASGTGGFLLAAHEYIASHFELDRDEKLFLRDHTFRGTEIVDNTARLCAMNLFLHGIGGSDINATPPIEVRDALLMPPSDKVDMVLANPPFGKKSSVTFVGEHGRATSEDESVSRQDFWATTSNKQLNFLQHIVSMLKIGGTAAVVLPDNVLFEGGAGETIRRRLLQECDVHTMLRLPTGIFYAQGVKANVLFLERRAPSTEPATKAVWVYDFRTNQRFTLKTRTMKRPDLDDFVAAYKPGELPTRRVESECFKRWTYEEIASRPGFNLDVWADVVDESVTDPSQLPPPDVIAQQIIENATAGIEAFAAVAAELAQLSANGDDRDEDAVEALLEHE